MPVFTSTIRGCGIALAGAVLAGMLGGAPARAMPIQPATPLAAVETLGVHTVQYRDWDRRRDWRRWERHRDMRSWDRERRMRRYDRYRRHRDLDRRNFY